MFYGYVSCWRFWICILWHIQMSVTTYNTSIPSKDRYANGIIILILDAHLHFSCSLSVSFYFFSTKKYIWTVRIMRRVKILQYLLLKLWLLPLYFLMLFLEGCQLSPYLCYSHFLSLMILACRCLTRRICLSML